MPLNWTSSRTIWVKREAWDLVESARAAKSAMATRGLLVSPSPVPARNHPWDCPNAAWAENAKIVRSGRRCFRLRTTCTLELGWTNGIRTLNRFFSFMDSLSPGNPRERRRPRLSNRWGAVRSEEHTSELQSLAYLVCRLLLE